MYRDLNAFYSQYDICLKSFSKLLFIHVFEWMWFYVSVETFQLYRDVTSYSRSGRNCLQSVHSNVHGWFLMFHACRGTWFLFLRSLPKDTATLFLNAHCFVKKSHFIFLSLGHISDRVQTHNPTHFFQIIYL